MNPSLDFGVRTVLRCLGALDRPGVLLGASMGLVLWLGFVAFSRVGGATGRLRAWLVSLALWFALTQALKSGWVADRAFIALRHAQNLTAGQGLVFNPGEKIGALANPAWALLLSLVLRLGLDAALAAVALCVASLAGVIWVLGRETAKASTAGWGLPMAALLVASSSLFWSYGTCGLPAMPSALLLLLCTTEITRRPARAGAYGMLAALLAPLCLSYVVVLGLSRVVRSRRRALLEYFTPLLIGGSAQLLFHRVCYGSYLPFWLTGSMLVDSRLERGFGYCLLGFIGHGFWSLLPGLFVAAGAGAERPWVRGILAAVCGYLFLLAWFGGDDLDGHLLIAVLPVLLLCAERGTRGIWHQGRWLSAAWVSAVPAAIAMPNTLLRPGMLDNLIDAAHADRKHATTLAPSDRCRVEASELERAFTGASVRPFIASSCTGVTAVATTLPVTDLTGEVEPHIFAHRIEWGGRRLRDRHMHAAYLWQKGVDISEVPVWPERYAPLYRVGIGALTMNLVRHREQVVRQLQSVSQARLPSIAEYLENYGEQDAARRACDTWFLDNYYFTAGSSETRRHQREAWLAARSLGQNEARFVAAGDSGTPAGWVGAPLDFHDASDFVYRGFGWPRWQAGIVDTQADVFWHGQRLLNTFQPEFEHGATGQLQSPEFEVTGEVITVDIGGGMAEDKLYVALLVQGKIERHATGCDSNILRRQAWDTASLIGKRARLLWVDQHTEPGGHLLTGEVVQWHQARRAVPGGSR